MGPGGGGGGLHELALGLGACDWPRLAMVAGAVSAKDHLNCVEVAEQWGGGGGTGEGEEE